MLLKAEKHTFADYFSAQLIMKIVIAGAGSIGFHLAQFLYFENQDITLIDDNQDELDYATGHLDVMTLRGDASSVRILREAGAHLADLVLAVTTSETTNLITASLARKLGAKQTIARISKSEYLEENNRALFTSMGINEVFSPYKLAAGEIHRLIQRCSFTDIVEFDEGKISFLGITLGKGSRLVNLPLNNWKSVCTDNSVRPIAILRDSHTIIPTGEVTLRLHDHVYFITNKRKVDQVERMVGTQTNKVRRIMILGGTKLALETARLLEGEFNLTIVEENKDRCKFLSEQLNNTLILHAKADNTDLLVREGLDTMNAFVALTDNSETNIIASLTAKNHGVYRTIAQVENKEYVHISQNIGVDTLINQKLIAAMAIARYIRKGKVEAIGSLKGVEAEIIEYMVTPNNRLLVGKRLRDIPFPPDTLVGGVIRGEGSLIPDGNFQLQQHDKVIVFAKRQAIGKLDNLFR
ncbi:MAG: Trk system potassium transporter TrkA [Bacteroidota bacterium]|jgi:trk system potassium uptake protein TrkA